VPSPGVRQSSALSSGVFRCRFSSFNILTVRHPHHGYDDDRQIEFGATAICRLKNLFLHVARAVVVIKVEDRSRPTAITFLLDLT
jgi:hypothetical protein